MFRMFFNVVLVCFYVACIVVLLPVPCLPYGLRASMLRAAHTGKPLSEDVAGKER